MNSFGELHRAQLKMGEISYSGALIQSVSKIERPEGYRLPGYSSLAVTVTDRVYSAEGFADAPLIICEQKAISEAVERLALTKYAKTCGQRETSNGWACHFTVEDATTNAIFELIERDVAVKAWERGGPFYEIPMSLWPELLRAWYLARDQKLEFGTLKLLLSYSENGCCVSALLFNEKMNFVCGHASAYEISDAALSAIGECFRAAHLALRFEFFAEVLRLHSGKDIENISPGAHSLAYAYTTSFPAEVEIRSASLTEIYSLWKSHQQKYRVLRNSIAKVQTFKLGDRFVVQVKDPRLQQIEWGKLNVNAKNKFPHFVG